MPILGLGSTFKYSVIALGSILQVPEGATGCSIENCSICGTLDLDESIDGVYNTWVTTVNLAGIGAGETVEFYNCAFRQSQTTIEGTLVAGAVNFTDCLFEISTANFINYAGSDFRLVFGSILIDVGHNTGVDTDILGISTPVGVSHDIGAYEFNGRIVRGTFRLTMALRM